MKKYTIFALIILLAFCGGNQGIEPDELDHNAAAESGEKEAGHSEEEDAEEHQDLTVTPEKQKEWGISLGQVELQKVASRMTLTGSMSLNQNRTALVSSFVNGQIASLSTDLGNRVSKGQALAVLNSPEFAQAQADFLQARAKFLLSQTEFERAKMLRKEKAIEEKEYLRREAEYQKLTTEYGALGSRLHSFGFTHEQIEQLIEKCGSIQDAPYKCEIADPFLTITAPIAGTIIFRDAMVGEHTEPEKTLFTLSDMTTLWAFLDAFEKDIPLITLKSRTRILSTLYPDQDFPGRITHIQDVIDEKLRTVKIRVEVDNRQGLLKPGMYIEGVVENPSSEMEILAVPEEAVQNLNGEKVVFAPEDDTTFTVKHVQIGDKIGNQRIILSGLELGEKIVIKGAFSLKTEMAKGTFGHAHIH